MPNSSTGDVHIDLTDDERLILTQGLLQWGGPADPSEALSRAMGFANLDAFWSDHNRIASALEARLPLSAEDWRRAQVATEVCFASDVLGAGYEWSMVTGLSDETTIRVLRAIQRKILTSISRR